MGPIGWPEVVTVIFWVAIAIAIAAIWLFRAARDSERMTEGRRLLIVVGVTAIVLLLIFAPFSPLAGSSVYVPLDGRPTAIVCDGSTHADEAPNDEFPPCGEWGAAILDDHLEYPPGIEAADIERLELEQALWGYVDRCTATAFIKGTTTTFEQEVPCWPMAERQ